MKKIHNITYSLVCFLLISALYSCGDTSLSGNATSVGAGLNADIQGETSTRGRLNRAEYVAGEILVKFRPETDAATMEGVNGAINATRIRQLGRVGVQHIKLSVGMPVEEAVSRYKEDPNVVYAEPNYILRASVIPNDPDFVNLWGLNNTGQTGGTADADLDAPEAWDLSTGSSNVVIAVIDTGVARNHPELVNNIWTNTGETDCADGIDDDLNGYIDDCNGWDFIGDDNDPTDYNGHGTHVSGTIAAEGNNSADIVGVMWDARIMPLRFLGVSGAGDTADAMLAIEYAADNGAGVINASWGGGPYTQALYDAIDYARSQNVIFVAAAGNEASDNDTNPAYPASYNLDNIISVAAVDDTDALASFSNFGLNSVDLGAPGVGIYSTVPVFSYGTPVTLYTTDFNSDAAGNLPSGWASGGQNDTWSVTAGTGVGGTNSLEDSPAANYVSNTYSWAGYMTQIPSVKDNRYMLSFQWKGYVDLDTDDYLNINYSLDGITWDWIDWRNGDTGGVFVPVFSDAFTVAADMFNNFYFGFGLESYAAGNYDGVYIDDVLLTREPISISGYSYATWSGTSMATPHVSGVAGLILSYAPGLTYSEVKNIILNTVVPISSLSGKTVTGGRVNAFNALQNSTLPAAPSGLSASAASSAGQINLSWTDNSTNETGFSIERKTGTGSFAEIATVGADVTTYSNTGLAEQTTYTYRVSSYNAAGNSAYSNEASATTALNAPAGLTATAASSSQINLVWTDNSGAETGFRIERKTGAGSFAEIATVGANATTYSNTGLAGQTTYTYRVRSYSALGNSAYSNEASATTLAASSGGGGGGGGGCFIATAAYGSYLAPEVNVLKDFRDDHLLTNAAGRKFVELYYRYSPPIADYIARNEGLRTLTRIALTPVVYSIKYPSVFILVPGFILLTFMRRRFTLK